ncbi:MAG: glycoside hydrolase family 3 protein [Clostridia bacterium]|nr:glycoside hydrolase family 3 protein [Clostridia bacterium]
MKKSARKISILVLSVILAINCSVTVGLSTFAKEETNAASFVEGLSVEEKICQMLMPTIRQNGYCPEELNDAQKAAIKKYNFGGYILFGGHLVDSEQSVKIISEFQEYDVNGNCKGSLAPFIAVDQEGGSVCRLKGGTFMPGNMALGAANDKALTKKAAAVIGKEVNSLGFNVDFAPVCDVNNNPSNPVIGVRSFSDDPETVATHVAAFIAGLKKSNTVSALKHFPGHGDTDTDSHTGLPLVDRSYEELKSRELIPFRAGIKAGAEMIMTAHIQYPQIETETRISKKTGETVYIPATMSDDIIGKILRGDMGYKGIVVTDALDMDAIAEHFDKFDVAKSAINAGVDILLIPCGLYDDAEIQETAEYVDTLVKMVNDGEIDIKKVDEAVTRIIKLKKDCDLVSRSQTDIAAAAANAKATVGSGENRKAEWEITQNAITLLKNDGVLPFSADEGKKTVIVYPLDNMKNAAEYALRKLKAENVIPADADIECVSFSKIKCDDTEFLEKVKSADNCLALSRAYGASALKPDKTAAGNQNAVISAVIAVRKEAGKPTAVLSCNLPYDVAAYTDANALMLAYNGKAMTVAPDAADAVPNYGINISSGICAAFGEFNPGGKLPVNIPKLDSNNDFTDEVLFERGAGIINGGEKPGILRRIVDFFKMIIEFFKGIFS